MAEKVTFQLKSHPTFVSDALEKDLLQTVEHYASGGGITPEYLAESFKAGTEAISFYGGAREGSRTMLDALFPASTALLAGSGVNGAAIASRQGADATAKMQHAEAVSHLLFE